MVIIKKYYYVLSNNTNLNNFSMDNFLIKLNQDLRHKSYIQGFQPTYLDYK